MEKVVGETATNAQALRNVLYAVASIAGLLGFVIPDDVINSVVLGVLGVVTLAGTVLAWWYSRKKFTVVNTGKHSA